MKKVTGIEILPANRQEVLGFAQDFPHLLSRSELDQYFAGYVPWHWHAAVELFYVESGEVEYNTPGIRRSFPAGTGGFVNSGVLHMTRPDSRAQETVQMLHLFDPALISGAPGGRIDQRYVLPLVMSGCEILALPPGSDVLALLKKSFLLEEREPGYELRLRALLSEIWLQLSDLASQQAQDTARRRGSDPLKRMMVYVHEHYAEHICIQDLAGAAYISQRECHRLFRDQLHCTPLEYITSYRLQMACERLKNTRDSVTAIGQACGFATSSRFGQVFARNFGCTPRQYRLRWQDRDKNRHEFCINPAGKLLE